MAAADGGRQLSGWRAAALFVCLTVVFTWPQAARLYSVPASIDTTFSLWRIAWIAHQLPVDPRRLFDANIFYPLRHTLVFSDAVLLEGLVGAPWIWLGAPTVVVYNLLVLAGFAASGLSAFLLVRDLTGSSAAAVIGGMVYAFAPFRFDHYIHLELLWAQWMPLAMWLLHRTLRSGRWRDGVLTGVYVGLQGLSCVYYLVFFGTMLVVAGPILLLSAVPAMRARAVRALAAGMLVAGMMLAPYAMAYGAARGEVGVRDRTTALEGYSAGPKHYLATPESNVLYGRATAGWSVHERRLFMGFLVMALTLVGVWPPLSRTRLAYAAALAVAVAISAGHRGLLLGWLYDHVTIYQALRVPARVSQITLICVAVLAGFGVARVLAWVRDRQPVWSRMAAVGMAAVVGIEYLMSPMPLTPMPTTPSASSAWLRSQPTGPVTNLPVPRHDTDWRRFIVESRYEFESTFHWRPVTNGYSGFLPASFYDNNRVLGAFPGDEAIARLRALGVRYVVVHERYYGEDDYRRVIEQARARADLEAHGPFADERYETRVFRILLPAEPDAGGAAPSRTERGISFLKGRSQD